VTEFLEDLFARTGKIKGHTDSIFGVEIYGGEAVPVLSKAPDPRTFRGQYYYNSTNNVLYKKVVVQKQPEVGRIIAFWQPVSSP
jgi:hypothetical protein